VDEGNDELDRWLAFANFMMSRTASSELDISHRGADRTARPYLA